MTNKPQLIVVLNANPVFFFYQLLITTSVIFFLEVLCSFHQPFTFYLCALYTADPQAKQSHVVT